MGRKLLGDGSDVLPKANLFRTGEETFTGCTKLIVGSSEIIATYSTIIFKGGTIIF